MKEPKKTVMTCGAHELGAEHQVGSMRTHHGQRDNDGRLPVTVIRVRADAPGI